MSPGIPVAERMAVGARYAAITGALGLAGAYTGWNFSKWMWHQSLTFAGGPAAHGIWNTAQAATGLAAQAMGAPTTPDQYRAIESFQNTGLGQVAGDVATSLFPYSSTARTVNNVVRMTRTTNPVEGTARSLITGETSLVPDINQYLESQDEAFMQRLREQGFPGVPGAGAQ